MVEPQTDQELMARVARGDAAALRVMIDRHLPRAHAIARRVLPTRADAEDAVQEAFTKVWIHAPAWEPGRASLSTWLYRIVVHTCIDAMRRRPGPAVELEAITDTLADGAPGMEAALATAQRGQQVRAAVQALPPQQRMAVVLCYFDELSNLEAAQLMGVHLKALEGLLVRARRGLRAALAPLNEVEPNER